MDFAFCKTLFQRKAKRFFTPTPPAQWRWARSCSPISEFFSRRVILLWQILHTIVVVIGGGVLFFVTRVQSLRKYHIFAGFTSALFQYKTPHVTTMCSILLTGSKTCFQCCCCCCCFLLLLHVLFHLLITFVFKWTLLKLQCLIQIQLYVCIDRNCFHIMPGQVNLPSSREGIACTM